MSHPRQKNILFKSASKYKLGRPIQKHFDNKKNIYS